MYKYVLKQTFDEYIQATYRNVVVRDYILTFIYFTYASLNTCGIKFVKLIIVWNISNLFLSILKHSPAEILYMC